MKYVSQLDYGHVSYNHNLDAGGAAPERRNVGTSGCGLASACMIVDHLTTQTLEIEECVRLSEDNGCSHTPGTDMTMLGPVIAEKFGLIYEGTEDVDAMLACLRSGGEAIVNVASKDVGCTALFTTGKHYMVLICVDGDELCIMDPNYKRDVKWARYQQEEAAGNIKIREPFLYCSVETLHRETADCSASTQHKYHLFKRKV